MSSPGSRASRGGRRVAVPCGCYTRLMRLAARGLHPTREHRRCSGPKARRLIRLRVSPNASRAEVRSGDAWRYAPLRWSGRNGVFSFTLSSCSLRTSQSLSGAEPEPVGLGGENDESEQVEVDAFGALEPVHECPFGAAASRWQMLAGRAPASSVHGAGTALALSRRATGRIPELYLLMGTRPSAQPPGRLAAGQLRNTPPVPR